MLSLASLSIQQASISFLCSKRSKYRILEPALMVAHYIGYIGILVFFLPAWEAGLFLVLHQAIIGMYLGSTFAPNHKGMLIIGELDSVDFLHQQVLTARNVKPNPVIDYWYGGLNYQIEHHLFPTMPRNKLKYAQPIVKAFCAEHGISSMRPGCSRILPGDIASLSPVGLRSRQGGTGVNGASSPWLKPGDSALALVEGLEVINAELMIAYASTGPGILTACGSGFRLTLSCISDIKSANHCAVPHPCAIERL